MQNGSLIVNERAPEQPSSDLARSALWIFVLLGLGAILVLAKEVLVPIALATLLSFALSPVVRALQKLGAPRALGAVVALAMFMGAIGVWVWFVSGQISDLAQRLPAYQHNIHEKLHAITEKLGGSGGNATGAMAALEDAVKDVAPAKEAVAQTNAPQPVVIVDNSPFARISVLTSFASPVLSPIGQFFIVLVFTAFLLAQQEDLRNRLIKLLGPKDIYRTTEAIDDAGGRIGRMLFAQVVMNSSFGLIVALSLWAFGVPNPALWGALAGISRFVPYVGVIIGVVPPLLVAFAFDPGWSSFLLTLGLFVVAEGITGQVIEPVVYGHSSGLSPTAVVVCAAFWAFLWGTVGLVLATPLTTCLVVLGRHAPGLAFLETLLGDEPPLTAQETFYQRMLAGDPREAASQARRYLKRGAIADYYDEVALEALRRAQVDVARGDLDDGRLAALTASTRQLLAWLGAKGAGGRGGWRAALRRLLRLGGGSGEVEVDSQPRARRAVAILHGEQPLDPLAAAMLAHVFTQSGLPSQIVSREEARMATSAQCAAVGLVCLCYMEPLTIAHLRAAAVAARRRCPQAKVIICIWRDPDDETFPAMARKLRCDAVVTGVAAAGAAARRLLGVGPTPWVLAFAPRPAPSRGAKAA